MKRLALLLTDAAVVYLSILAAIYLRFEGDIPLTYQGSKEVWLPLLAVILNLVMYRFFDLYSKVWRYAGVHELKSISLAVVCGYSPFILASFASGGFIYSRSIILNACLINIALVGATRFALRLVNEPSAAPRIVGARKVLIVGANDAGEAILRELLRHPAHAYFPVGFVDTGTGNVGMRLRQTPVLGSLEDLPKLAAKHAINEIILGVPEPKTVRKLVSLCEGLPGVELKLVPSVSDVVEGRTTVSQIREVRIEDLLERDPVDLQIESIASCIEGKRVLVTGAGGSIGSEICRQVSRLGPQSLILVGRGENSIHEISVELRSRSTVPLQVAIADVRDGSRLRKIFQETRPQVVFHAAAHKHVPLMEANPEEAVTVNILGTRLLVELSAEFGVERFVLLSSDKAVNACSVMGASKRMAELIVRAAAARSSNTVFVAVRFGNVLGSRGSVIPTFRRQIALGGPVTVTDADMTRYFMTIPEAVALVIQASALAAGGEIYILDMGEPVRILDLARNMIRLSGYEPDTDIPIQFLGIRPGEKMSEELLNSGEEACPTAVAKIQKVKAPAAEGGDSRTSEFDSLAGTLVELEACAQNGDEARLRQMLGVACGVPLS